MFCLTLDKNRRKFPSFFWACEVPFEGVYRGNSLCIEVFLRSLSMDIVLLREFTSAHEFVDLDYLM